MFGLFAERAWQLYLEKGDESIEYAMLEEQDRVMGHLNSPVTLEEGQQNLNPGADSNFDNLPDVVDDDDDCHSDGAIGVESAHRVGIKRNY